MPQSRYQNGTRYLVEGRTLNELLEADQTNTLLKGTGYDVKVDPGVGTTLRIAAPRLYTPGFWVSWSPDEEGKVIVSPSVVSGMSGASLVPVVGSDPLTNSPSISVGPGNIIALKIEADPTVRNTGTIDDPNFVIIDGDGLIDGDVEVTVATSLSNLNHRSEVAIIDNATGEITQRGVYLIPLAMIMDQRTILQIGHIGPIGVRMCAAGTLVVTSPALQVIAVDDKGNIVAPPAP